MKRRYEPDLCVVVGADQCSYMLRSIYLRQTIECFLQRIPYGRYKYHGREKEGREKEGREKEGRGRENYPEETVVNG